MITKDMIEKGYEQGIVRLIESPNGDGVVCGIGDNWFYFGGDEAESSAVEEYRRNVPAEDIVNEIFEVLEGFWEDGDVFEDEYLYYEAFLNENLKEVSEKDMVGIVEKSVRQVDVWSEPNLMVIVEKLQASWRAMNDACLALCEIKRAMNEGLLLTGWEPVQFDCETSPELATEVRDLVGMVGKLTVAAGMDRAELAKMIFEEHYPVAYEVSKMVQREKNKEEIESELDEVGVYPDELSPNELERLVDKFEENLENSDSYGESYWRAAQGAVDSYLRDSGLGTRNSERGKVSLRDDLNSGCGRWGLSDNCEELGVMPKEDVGKIVEAAVLSIRGVGPDMGSGCYDLREFVVEGQKFNLYVDICDLEEDYTHGRFYEVYYAVEWKDGDNLFSQWVSTSGLDVDELKRTVFEIANTDFSKKIKECLSYQNTVRDVISNAVGRSEVQDVGGKSAEEYVKE